MMIVRLGFVGAARFQKLPSAPAIASSSSSAPAATATAPATTSCAPDEQKLLPVVVSRSFALARTRLPRITAKPLSCFKISQRTQSHTKMTSIKRILWETSCKILGAMGASSRSGSHSLVNCSAGGGDQNQVPMMHTQRVAANKKSTKNQPGAKRMGAATARTKSSTKNKSKHNKHSSATAIPEALLIASKNHLPPVQFHHVHGPNVQLQKNKFVARRTQSFCQALVFSNRVILPNERVYIKVTEIAKGWSGTIRFGFTSVDPATLRYQMPKHACPDMTNAGHTWARALADEVIKRNSVIHFSYNTNGFIHYGINNQDCGIFHADVNTNQNLWFLVDIYGLTAAVELIDPRVHNSDHSATSDLDISRDDGDDDLLGATATTTTMFKSTSAMDELLAQHLALRAAAKKNKRSRKSQSSGQPASAAIMYHPHPHIYHHGGRNHLPEGVILPPGIGFAAAGSGGRQGPLLPNLSSVMLPSAQQNIYSPMPAMINTNSNTNSSRPEHDYYQIMTNATINNNNNNQAATPTSSRNHHNSSLISSGRQSNATDSSRIHSNHHHAAAAPTPTINFSSSISEAANSNNVVGRRGARRRTAAAAATDGQAEICQQLSGLQINQSDNRGAATTTPVNGSNSKQQYSAVKSSSSSSSSSAAAGGARHPVAAARRRLQSSIDSKDSSHSSSRSSSGVKAKTRQSVGNSKSALKSTSTPNNRDNQQTPPSKDCPICFERPINCVLYQCGHMCTCYECGVKQWRTQQRTCPICRTIIKDVIKTYMS